MIIRIATLLLFLVSAGALTAGTPLICHPYTIGPAKSLPGFANRTNTLDPEYNREHLVTDTLALLTPQTPTIVRMETLRRAVMYATLGKRGEDGLADLNVPENRYVNALLGALQARASAAPHDSLTQFDFGFLVQTLRHIRVEVPIDGYALMQRAASERPQDASMEFALALAGSWPMRRADRDTHLAKARAGATGNPLLVANLETHFGGS